MSGGISIVIYFLLFNFDLLFSRRLRDSQTSFGFLTIKNVDKLRICDNPRRESPTKGLKAFGLEGCFGDGTPGLLLKH